MLDLLLRLPVVGPVLTVLLLVAVVLWAPFMNPGGQPTAEEVRAGEAARCRPLLDEFERRRALGLPAERPQGC